MLNSLRISNYAIIDELELSYSEKLTILTGETGAGKSIIIGALGLILGDRADNSTLKNRDKKCIVEGVFRIEQNEAVKKFLAISELDADSEIVLRREISPTGKSRAFINDTPVNLSQLQQVAALLVDLHQQFDTISLEDSNFQKQVVDALAGTLDKAGIFEKKYKSWKESIAKLELMRLTAQQSEKEKDFISFQLNELQEAALKENELEDLSQELQLLGHAENIQSTISKTFYALEESDTPVSQQLKSMAAQLTMLENYHPELKVLAERLRAAQVEVHDIANDLAQIQHKINYDPAKIEQINNRLSLGYRLMKKHAVQHTNDLLDLQQNFENQLQRVLNLDVEINAITKESEELFTDAMQLAVALSNDRKKIFPEFEKKVNSMLSQVGMPNAILKVNIEAISLSISGVDKIEFLFDANRSGHLSPLRKIASGGELSRLMLCIKSLVAESIDLPTLIFDEIDTGISGEAARQVGMIMKDLAQNRQVICITHQPQIAGRADAHLFVFKEIKNDTVYTGVRLLDRNERITAIARMLSGEKPTAAALENAREMVMN